MDELAHVISERLGVDEPVVRKAMGALLRFMQDRSGSFDFDKVISSLPGAESLMKGEDVEQTARAEPTGGSSGGLFGLIFNLVFSLLKTFGVIAMLRSFLLATFGEDTAKILDSVEDGAQVAALLNKLGIDKEKGIQMVRMLLVFMREKADPETIDKLTNQIPAIKTFLEDKKED